MSVIHNWRMACDERGLSQSQRSAHNRDFLEFILDELMPWHKEQYDFITQEINHYTKLKFVCDVRPSVRAGGHGKPFDPS